MTFHVWYCRFLLDGLWLLEGELSVQMRKFHLHLYTYLCLLQIFSFFREIVNSIFFILFQIYFLLFYSFLCLYLCPLVKASNIFPISQIMSFLPCCSCPYWSSNSLQFYYSSSAAISGYLFTSAYLDLGSSDGREHIYDMQLISYCV